MIKLDYAPYRVHGFGQILEQVGDVALEQVGLRTWRDREWVLFMDRNWYKVIDITSMVKAGLREFVGENRAKI
jgi:hypothetical protein